MARILLVDDDKDIRDFGRAILHQAGHEVFAVAGALPAIEFLNGTHVDILITDANMPHHTGFDLIKTLKRNARFKDLTIAMLTGRRERKDIEAAVGLGVSDYIVKPLDPMLFLRKVNDLAAKAESKQTPAESSAPAAPVQAQSQTQTLSTETKPSASSDTVAAPEPAKIEFAELKLNAPAHVRVGAEILALSEVGVLVRSPQPFEEGARLDLDSELFKRIGIDPPLLRVLSCVEREGAYDLRVGFVGADEKTLTKVRAWVHSSMARSRSRAA